MKACIVVPTIRENCIKDFLAAWSSEFEGHHLIIVEDNPTRTFELPKFLTHVAWEDIEEDLKQDSWIIPRRSGAIRNYGNLLASRIPGLDMIVNLDDDCMPDEPNLLAEHWSVLETPGMAMPCHNTMRSLDERRIKPRGYPKTVPQITTVLNHGLWNGVPDIDGETQLKYDPGPDAVWNVQFPRLTSQVQVGALFPMSAMNIAFRPELLPAMYNLPMGAGQPFHRFDDIWCGLIMKKTCDAMGWAVRSGSPCIHHVRASDAKRNAELEAPGIIENERVWKLINDIQWTDEERAEGLYHILAGIHGELDALGTYWDSVHNAANTWRKLIRSQRADRLPT